MITMAELHLDAANSASLPCGSSNSPSSAAMMPDHLQACADWLALAQEADMLSSASEGFDQQTTPLSQQGTSQPEHSNRSQHAADQPSNDRLARLQLAARFSWTSGRLADCRKDHDSAFLHYTNTLMACEALQQPALAADHPASPSLEGDVFLSHCQQDGRISASTALAKLQVLQLSETCQQAAVHLGAGAAQEALELLQQELLQDPAFAAKASQHDPAGFLEALQLLLVSLLTPLQCHILPNACTGCHAVAYVCMSVA